MGELSDVLKENGISSGVVAAIEENKGFIVIMAGSDSDRTHIDKISSALNSYQIPHQVRIASAHKQSMKVEHLIGFYDLIKGALAYIAVAGGTDALSGQGSYLSVNPVISCPPDAPNDSCLKNPPGSSNAYIANPKNAARFVAQMFSHLPGTFYREILKAENEKKIISLEDADEKLRVFPYVREVKK